MFYNISKILAFVIIHNTLWALPSVKWARLKHKLFARELPPPFPLTHNIVPFSHTCIFCMNQNCDLHAHSPQIHKQQCVVVVKNGMLFCKSKLRLYLSSNDYFDDKEMLTISPAGLKGFYLLGVLQFIKEHYDTAHLVYSGASAGSWSGLFMCFKGDTRKLIYELLESGAISGTKSAMEIQYMMKYLLLAKYSTDDFDLRRLFVGVSGLRWSGVFSHIFTDFRSLEDAIDCCMASSHIPFVTGGLSNKYNNMFSLDGGFGNFPYLNVKNKLHISPNIWKETAKRGALPVYPDHSDSSLLTKLVKSLFSFGEFFSLERNSPLKLFDDGYQDTKLHRKHLDAIFLPKCGEEMQMKDVATCLEYDGIEF